MISTYRLVSEYQDLQSALAVDPRTFLQAITGTGTAQARTAPATRVVCHTQHQISVNPKARDDWLSPLRSAFRPSVAESSSRHRTTRHPGTANTQSLSDHSIKYSLGEAQPFHCFMSPSKPKLDSPPPMTYNSSRNPTRSSSFRLRPKSQGRPQALVTHKYRIRSNIRIKRG